MLDLMNPKVEAQGNAPKYGTVLIIHWFYTVSTLCGHGHSLIIGLDCGAFQSFALPPRSRH
jgi:hypothetical protein